MFRKYSFFLFLFFSFSSFTQNVFDLGVRQIEIFFSEPNWNDTLHAYYSNNQDQRLIADSIIIDGEVDQNVGIKYFGNIFGNYFQNIFGNLHNRRNFFSRFLVFFGPPNQTTLFFSTNKSTIAPETCLWSKGQRPDRTKRTLDLRPYQEKTKPNK